AGDVAGSAARVDVRLPGARRRRIGVLDGDGAAAAAAVVGARSAPRLDHAGAGDLSGAEPDRAARSTARVAGGEAVREDAAVELQRAGLNGHTSAARRAVVGGVGIRIVVAASAAELLRLVDAAERGGEAHAAALAD